MEALSLSVTMEGYNRDFINRHRQSIIQRSQDPCSGMVQSLRVFLAGKYVDTGEGSNSHRSNLVLQVLFAECG